MNVLKSCLIRDVPKLTPLTKFQVSRRGDWSIREKFPFVSQKLKNRVKMFEKGRKFAHV